MMLFLIACSPESDLVEEDFFQSQEGVDPVAQASKIKWVPVADCQKKEDKENSRFVQGSLTFKKNEASQWSKPDIDTCQNNGVIEYYCRDGDLISRTFIKCKDGCENGACIKKYDCNEYQYWKEVSDEFPYPGMNCESGPSKTIGISVVIAKKVNSEKYIDNTVYLEEVYNNMINMLNNAFNDHGIKFILNKISYSDIPTPQNVIDTGNYKFYIKKYFEDNYDTESINIVFIPSGLDVSSSCSQPYPINIQQTYKTNEPDKCQSNHHSTKNTEMVHEVAHYLGVTHTWNDETTSDKSSYENRGPTHVTPIKNCHKTGDFVCDTPYDCYPSNDCQLELNCPGIVKTKVGEETLPNGKTVDLYEDVVDCPGYEEDFKLLLENEVSYWTPSHGEDKITDEQGARARYYLMYRLNNEINGNQLEEIS